MSKITYNEPAFPSTKEYTEGGKDFIDTPVIVHKESFGLTKREYFAAMALQGILSNGYNSVIQGAEHAVIEAVSVADLIFLQLNKPHDQP